MGFDLADGDDAFGQPLLSIPPYVLTLDRGGERMGAVGVRLEMS
jgi:hypothetical protein